MIVSYRLLTTGMIAAGLLAGCASDDSDSLDLVGTTQAAGSDAIGLPRERPGRVMVDEGDETVPTPYGGTGSRRTCSSVALDIARLTAVIGPDQEFEPRTEAEREERSIWDRGQDLMTAEQAGDAAMDAYHSAIVGLNPVRPVIRFIGGASEIESEARQQRQMALKRRAYLRGLYDGFGCDRAYLVRVFEDYGLTRSAQSPEDEQ